MWSVYLLLICLAANVASAFPGGFGLEHLKALQERGFPRDELLSWKPEAAAIIDLVEKAIKDHRASFEAPLKKRQGGGLLGVESQCGIVSCPTFDENSQFVDVRDGSEL